jgi:hypothetical protein
MNPAAEGWWLYLTDFGSRSLSNFATGVLLGQVDRVASRSDPDAIADGICHQRARVVGDSVTVVCQHHRWLPAESWRQPCAGTVRRSSRSVRVCSPSSGHRGRTAHPILPCGYGEQPQTRARRGPDPRVPLGAGGGRRKHPHGQGGYHEQLRHAANRKSMWLLCRLTNPAAFTAFPADGC